jgi:hypothetical protein
MTLKQSFDNADPSRNGQMVITAVAAGGGASDSGQIQPGDILIGVAPTLDVAVQMPNVLSFVILWARAYACLRAACMHKKNQLACTDTSLTRLLRMRKSSPQSLPVRLCGAAACRGA